MHIFNIENFISKHITGRESSMFAADIKNNEVELSNKIKGKSVLVIGGAGTIGSSYIRAILKFLPAEVYVIDINENGLTELVRDCRSNEDIVMPSVFLTYPLSFSDPIFEKIFRAHGRFDIVANFAAHKHVRSEKDHFSIEAMVQNNVIKAKLLLDLLVEFPPNNFFCVSTDKAANPVNVMGASKKLMEEVIMAYATKIPITTARFANVAFSNGSLLFGFIERLMKQQPLSAPNDVKRYFVSPNESGEICMLACMLGQSGEVFFPKLLESSMKTFSEIGNHFIEAYGLTPIECATENEAKKIAKNLDQADKNYPVFYFSSDTSGEKSFEEFYTENEIIDAKTYSQLGVVKNTPKKPIAAIDEMILKLENIFSEKELNKQALVSLLQEFIPNFSHIETGKSLDQKM
jgi:FlaA1/EpsC-like NDP-sugar epimerase